VATWGVSMLHAQKVLTISLNKVAATLQNYENPNISKMSAYTQHNTKPSHANSVHFLPTKLFVGIGPLESLDTLSSISSLEIDRMARQKGVISQKASFSLHLNG
jgi:hypothetical protein